MRLMYWPNEPTEFDESRLQIGGRNAFNELLNSGELSALSIYPYRSRLLNLGSSEFEKEVANLISEFRPDILFVQHVTGANLPSFIWSETRRRNPALTIVYHDADPYAKFAKCIDQDVISVLKEADLVLACGLGKLGLVFEKYSTGLLRYSPHCFDFERFGRHDVKLAKKQFDIAMIGNRGRRRKLRFLYLPGGRRRARLAKALSDRHGTSFALFGSGWDGLASNRGKLDFLAQEQAIQSARISVNWDHFDDIPYYFSDRLPISLAAGVPHVTTYHAGYEHIFQGCEGLYPCQSWQEVVDCSQWLLSKSDEELLDLGLKARSWVENNLEAKAVFRSAFRLSVVVHAQRAVTFP